MKMHGTTTKNVRSLFAEAFKAVNLARTRRSRIDRAHQECSTRLPTPAEHRRRERRELYAAIGRSDRGNNLPSGALAHRGASQCSRHRVAHLRFPAPAAHCHTIRVRGSTSLAYRQSTNTR